MSYLESGRAIALGLALVDEKIYNPNLKPPNGQELLSFLDNQTNIIRSIGGITSNVISAFSNFTPSARSRLLACIGNDERGLFFTAHTDPNLGPLQKVSDAPTGVALTILDSEGTVVVRTRYFGAANRVVIPKAEFSEKNLLFITDLFTMKNFKPSEDMDKLIQSTAASGGMFALNLGGMNAANGSSEELSNILQSLRQLPDFVVGNENEYEYLTKETDMDNLIEKVFPSSNIVIITQGSKGSLIRFNGKILHIPAFKIPDKTVADETGAGDCYTGVILSALIQKAQFEWTDQHVTGAALTGSFAAAIVVQSSRSRLNHEEMQKVKDFYNDA